MSTYFLCPSSASDSPILSDIELSKAGPTLHMFSLLAEIPRNFDSLSFGKHSCILGNVVALSPRDTKLRWH